MSRSHVLIIDDDPDVRRMLAILLQRGGYEVLEAENASRGLELLEGEAPEIVLVDLNLPDGTGFDIIRRARSAGNPVCMIVITAHGTVQDAVRALQEGADNFVVKPLDPEVLLALLRKAEEALLLKRQVFLGSAADTAVAKLSETESPAMQRVVEALPAIAASDNSVLITGESGTGKSLLARALHELSPRKDRPFVELNCSSLSRELLESELFGHSVGAFTGATRAKPGLVEVADHGTLFLDEVGDIDASVQPKLLKVIEDKQIRRLGSVQAHEVDVRILAATHFDLNQRIADGEFRHDLYYRLDVLHVHLPPLRERVEDLPDLAKSFLRQRAAGPGEQIRGFAPEALTWLRNQEWRGNIRELRNLVERACVYAVGGLIKPDDFGLHIESRGPMRSPAEPGPQPAAASAPSPVSPAGTPLSLADVEQQHVDSVLKLAKGNKTRAAKMLGITRQTLLRKIRTYGLSQDAEEA